MNNLRTIRFFQGMSQDALAKKAGIFQSDVSRLERGCRVSDNVRSAVALALGVSVQALGENPKEAKSVRT